MTDTALVVGLSSGAYALVAAALKRCLDHGFAIHRPARYRKGSR